MRIDLLKRVAVGTTRGALFVAAAALLVASWSGVALAGDPVVGTPEINVGAVGGAMTLLSGGLLLLRERFRSSKSAK